MDGPAACHRLHVPVGVVGERTLESVTDSVSPQGVVALVTRTGGDGALLERLLSPRRRTFRMILLTGVADPGNVGTLCRSAAAFGFDAFVTHAGADPFGPKVLRATAGSFLDLPYGSVTDATRLLKTFADMGVKTIATTPRGDVRWRRSGRRRAPCCCSDRKRTGCRSRGCRTRTSACRFRWRERSSR